MPKSQRQAEVQRQSDKFKASMLRYNLYFKNIPSDSTEEELKEYFS
jgi:RNA recognition motif-containing protein